MSPTAQYADQYWQLENKLAELHSKRYQVAIAAQYASVTLYELERDIEEVQRELREYGVQR